jgi:hypothetical protein
MGKSLKDWHEDHEYFSGQASKVSRALALGGIGIIWLFRNFDDGRPSLDPEFSWPLVLLTLSLFLDLLHYIVGAIIWQSFYLYHEANTPPENHDDIEAPYWKMLLISSFFYLKVLCMVCSYLVLVVVLSKRLFY